MPHAANEPRTSSFHLNHNVYNYILYIYIYICNSLGRFIYTVWGARDAVGPEPEFLRIVAIFIKGFKSVLQLSYFVNFHPADGLFWVSPVTKQVFSAKPLSYCFVRGILYVDHVLPKFQLQNVRGKTRYLDKTGKKQLVPALKSGGPDLDSTLLEDLDKAIAHEPLAQNPFG